MHNQEKSCVHQGKQGWCMSCACVSTHTSIKTVFGSVIVSVFQITFRVKININDIFLFFKNYF